MTEFARLRAEQRGVLNCYGVQRIAAKMAPSLRAQLETLAPGPDRVLLAELVELVLALAGCATDGSDSAQNAMSMIPTISYGGR